MTHTAAAALSCVNCGRITNRDRLRRQRCRSCYRYWRAHGSDRPQGEMNRYPKQRPPICAHCKQKFVDGCSKHLCSACYQYKRTTGKPRPRYFWAEKCKICGKPRRDDRRDGFAKGRCPPCYTYHRRHGEDRSPDLIAAAAPHGYCECGRPAVAVVALHYGPYRSRADYPLCSDCLKNETG